jgi:hypothetical protein
MHSFALWPIPCYHPKQTTNLADHPADEDRLGSLPMYLLFAPTALSLLSILAISLYSEFAAKANL